MIIKVEMLAFEDKPETFRPVDITGKAPNMESVFHQGQNCHQPQDYCSVSVGDVIYWTDGEKYIVADFGFKKLTRAEYEEYKAVPRRDRSFHPLCKS